MPPWVTEVLAQIQDDADATIAGERKVDVMEAVCVVCLGGVAKARLWAFRFLEQPCAAFASASNIVGPKAGPNEAHCGEFLRLGDHGQKNLAKWCIAQMNLSHHREKWWLNFFVFFFK